MSFLRLRRVKLDNWLAQRAQSCPERTALVTEASSVTYAELEAEATWSPAGWPPTECGAKGLRPSPCTPAARRSCCFTP